jgi:hypothetical protein
MSAAVATSSTASAASAAPPTTAAVAAGASNKRSNSNSNSTASQPALAAAIAELRAAASNNSSNNNTAGSNKKVRVADTYTENGALAHSSTGSARLDLFFGGFVRGAARDKIEAMLVRSWRESPEDTLKLILHSRDARNGKGEKACSMVAWLWLRDTAPITYMLNLHRYLDVGYYKDLLVIAAEVSQREMPRLGQLEVVELEVFSMQLQADIAAFAQWQAKSKAAQQVVAVARAATTIDDDDDDADSGEWMDVMMLEELKVDEAAEEKADKENAAESASSSSASSASSPASSSSSSVKKLRPPSLSLAGKWAPTEKTFFDKPGQGRLARRLAHLWFGASHPQCYSRAYRQALSQLRENLRVVERFMCAGEWNRIEFSHVSSKCHLKSKKAFAKHCDGRYESYLSELKAGTAKINTAGLHPHELVNQYMSNKVEGGGVDETVEAQWRTLVGKLKQAGSFSSALAVVDVSGSMSGIPMMVAITLGLIVADMTTGPFHNRLITFDANPNWHVVEEDSTLRDKVTAAQAMRWGCNTDMLKVFTLILNTAVSNKVKQCDLPKTLFIFSDMQFDQATTGGAGQYKTTHATVKAMYKQHHYTPPSIVYWNLRGDTCSFPVCKDTPDVAMVSGFSADLLKLFLSGEPLTAEGIMHMALTPYEVEVEDSEK